MTIVTVYVDDILVNSLDPTSVSELKTFLHQKFTIKDLGFLLYFLGLEVHYLANGIILTNRKFT